jgi:hypothetical protein
MDTRKRMLITVFVFLIGIVMVPIVGLPAQGFSWERYANVYDLPSLEVNHSSGMPGSFFSFEGTNFSPDTLVTITVNQTVLGSLQTSSQGEFDFQINTSGADPGLYRVLASGRESAQALFWLVLGDELWPPEDDSLIFNLPAGLALHTLLMPVLQR